jgi:hypothetical protein
VSIFRVGDALLQILHVFSDEGAHAGKSMGEDRLATEDFALVVKKKILEIIL